MSAYDYSRPPTLYGVPKTLEQFPTIQELFPKFQEQSAAPETFGDQQNKPANSFKLRISKPQETSAPATSNLSDAHILSIVDASKDTDTVSNNSERKRNVLKIKVKQPGSSSKADDIDQIMENSRGGQNDTNEVVGPTSSVSVDAPNHHDTSEPPHVSNQNIEEVNSCYVYESRVTASIGSSAKLNKDGVQELQCTADSKKSILGDQSSPVTQRTEVEVHQEHSHLQEATEKRKAEKKKDKEKKRKREDKSGEKDRSNDPEYLERKRQKKEKKRLKKMAKMMKKGEGSLDDSMKPVAESSKGDQSSEGSKKLQGKVEDRNILKPKETSSAPKLKIKIRSLGGKNG